jgi:hypothetical protein
MKNEKEFPAYPPLVFVRITQNFRNFLLRIHRRFTHPNVVLWEMVHNLWLAAGISVAAELGIADLLKEGPLTTGELARMTGTHEGALYRVMRMLASHGIFKETRNNRFASTRLSKSLQDDQIRYLILLHLTPKHFNMFGEIMTSVRTGKNVSVELEGSALFAHIAGDETRNEWFNRAMTAATRMQVSALLPVFPFSRYGKIYDIGGGEGLFLASLLRHTTANEGLVFDLPNAVRQTGEIIRQFSLEDRMTALGGDFFKSVPPGGDLYILKSVIHDWDDADALKILRNIYVAMGQGSILLIIDAILDEGNRPSFGKMTDILMMVSAGGKERTLEEFRSLTEKAGFRIRKVHPTVSPHSIIEAEKAPVLMAKANR